MAKDVAHGMTWLHESKPRIIHRDMKPSNLLVGDHNVVKVCGMNPSPLFAMMTKHGLNTSVMTNTAKESR